MNFSYETLKNTIINNVKIKQLDVSFPLVFDEEITKMKIVDF